MRNIIWYERFPLLAREPWRASGITVAAVLIALVLRMMLKPVLPAGYSFVTFFPVIIAVGFLLGVRMGSLAVVLSTALALAFVIRDPEKPTFVLQTLPAIVPFLILASMNLVVFHWMQRANLLLLEERRRSDVLAQTRETLFHELQHRVSNNLQIAAALLALQKKHLSDRAALAAIEEAARRLHVIGRISRQLYAADGAPRGMREFLAPLCADIVEMSGRIGVSIAVSGDEAIRIAPNAALPLALIVAESVSNAIEHGFAEREGGRIDVVLARDGEAMVLVEIRDDGRGLPEGFDLVARASLGLGIARTLAEQLGGSFTLTGSNGATARLRLREEG